MDAPETVRDEERTCRNEGDVEETDVQGIRHGDDTNEDDESDEDNVVDRRTKRNTLPVDHGWAWVITAASFVFFMIFPGHGYVVSVLLLDIIDHFNTSQTAMTVMISLNGLAYCVGCQVSSNFFIPRMSHRKLFICCAVFNSFCSLLMMFTPNMALYTFVHNIKIFSHGVALMPILALVGHYFKRRRALASSLTLLGMSSSSLFAPLFIRYLIDEYGWQGCLLIYSAYEMQAIVAASLLRPVSSYQSIPDDQENDRTAIKSNLSNQRKACEHMRKTTNMSDPEKYYSPSPEGQSPNEDDTWTEADKDLEERRFLFNSRQKTMPDDSRYRKGEISSRRNGSQVSNLIPGFSNSSDAVDAVPRRKQSSRDAIEGADGNHGPDTRNGDDRHQKLLSKSHDFVSKISLSSSLMASTFSLVEIEGIIRKEDIMTEQRTKTNSSATKGCRTVLRGIFNLSMMRSSTGIVYLLSYILARSTGIMMVYLPSYATQLGMDKTKAALLLVIYGGVDMVSRLFFGYIGDLNLTRPKYIIAVSCLVTSAFLFFGELYTRFPLLVFFSSALGFFGLVSLSLHTNNIIDMHGLDKLGPYLAQASLLVSLSSMVQFPIVGAIIEAVGGSLVCVFYYTAVCYFLAAAVIITHALCTRISSRRKEKNVEMNTVEPSNV